MSTSPSPRVAFLGLGLMGAPMARRLANAGLSPAVWNRSPGKTEALVAAGAIEASSPGEAAADADIVCLCLTDTKAVETVAFGPEGFAGHLRPGAVVVDFSSIGLDETRDFAARLSLRDAYWVDAPVSGGTPAAQSGQLIIFCGGDAEAVAKAGPVFEPLSRQVTHLGPSGAGQIAKLCNQLIVSVNMVAIAEAIALGRTLGADPVLFPQALKGGFADSTPLQIFGPKMASKNYQPKQGAIATLLKDVRNIQAAALNTPLQLTMLEKAASVYGEAIARRMGDEDMSQIMALYE